MIKSMGLNKFFGKIIFIFVILFSICFGSKAQDTTLVEGPTQFKYPNGQVSSEGMIKNGKPDGYWKTYFENGVLKSEGNRVNFKLDGPWKFYNDKGKMTAEYYYSGSKKNG